MTTTATPTKEEKTSVSQAENQKGIENHKKIATHLQKAAEHHLEAAKHHENEEHENAAKSTIAAQGHVALATEAQREDVKKHALNN